MHFKMPRMASRLLAGVTFSLKTRAIVTERENARECPKKLEEGIMENVRRSR